VQPVGPGGGQAWTGLTPNHSGHVLVAVEGCKGSHVGEKRPAYETEAVHICRDRRGEEYVCKYIWSVHVDGRRVHQYMRMEDESGPI